MCPSRHYTPPFPWDLEALPFIAMEDHLWMPSARGVYFFRTDAEVLYVGASSNLAVRLSSHNLLPFLAPVLPAVWISWLVFPHAQKTVLAALEKRAITHYKPLLNKHNIYFYLSEDSEITQQSLQRSRTLLAHILPAREETTP